MEKLFRGIFKGRKVLVTGDTGFKGSWLCIWLKELGADVYGYALPTKSPNDNFVRCNLNERIVHQDGDVTDYPHFSGFVNSIQPDFVFHLAAQPLVLYSYKNPRETYHTNLMGTVNFLEIVRECPSIKVALNVTSDKCYENQNWVWGYRENDPMGGSDPYSSSKGCSELITAAYNRSYFQLNGLKSIASARAGNVIGGGDWAEDRIIPDFFRAIIKEESLTIRNPDFTRPWQLVLEPLSGYLLLASKMYEEGSKFSGGWNFGPEDSNHYSVKHLIEGLIKIVGRGNYICPELKDKQHEAYLLKLDISKAMKQLAWRPVLDFNQTALFTANGYLQELSNSQDLYQYRVKQILEYLNLAKQKQLNWAF